MKFRVVKNPKSRPNARNRFTLNIRGQKSVILNRDELAKELEALRGS
jgi:hypothetical protein